jgi:hypothetical protein
VKVSSFYSKIQSPVLADVKFAIDGDNASNIRLSQVYPNILPDLFKGETMMAFGRYSGTGKVADPTERRPERATKGILRRRAV